MKSKRYVSELFFWIIVLISSVALVHKAFIVTDISLTDESHMIATAYRFFLGDAPLVDDWSPEQLHGIVLLPFLQLFFLFFNTTDGIILAMRFFYFLIKLLILIYCFFRLRNEKNTYCLFAALLLWYFFVPYNIDSLTYQATPLICLMYLCVVYKINEVTRLEYVLAGVLYAVSILSQPFWLISYLFVALWAGKCILKKEADIRKIVYFHLGIICVFLGFIFLIFSRASFQEVITNFQYILFEPDHNMKNNQMISKIINVFWGFIRENKIASFINILYLGILIICPKRRNILGMYICLLVSVLIVFIRNSAHLMNEMFVPFLWTGLENTFFNKQKEYKVLLSLSILFMICTAMGTNTGKWATSASLCILAIVVLFNIEIDNNDVNIFRLEKSIVYILVALTFMLRFFITWEGVILSPANYENKIMMGPMKGMYAEKHNYDTYLNIWNDIHSLEISKNDILFCGTATPLAYLDAQVQFGTMATPFFYLDYERLSNYFMLHKDKQPTVVYYYELTERDKESQFWTELEKENTIIYLERRAIAKKE